MASGRASLVAAILGLALFGVLGAWALADPASFYALIATYPPYNRHLVHDLGAFQLGIAAALGVSLTNRSGREVALWGAGAASVFHAISHWLDRGTGGSPSDPIVLTAVAALLVAAAAVTSGRGRMTADR